MIGKICISIFPYYDSSKKENLYKKRPILIISEARNNDYTVLPISTISKKENIDNEFDIKIAITDYPLLNLDKDCYIRTHKQTIVHKVSITKEISDLKETYEDLFCLVFKKLDCFNKMILHHARNFNLE